MCFTGPLSRHCAHCRTHIRHDRSYQSFCYRMVLTGECDEHTIKEPHDWTKVFKDVCADCKPASASRSQSQSQSENLTTGKRSTKPEAKAKALRNDGKDEDGQSESEKSETSNNGSTTTKASSTSTPKGHDSDNDTDTDKRRTHNKLNMRMSSEVESGGHQLEHDQEKSMAEDTDTSIPFCENWDRVSVDWALRQFIGRCILLWYEIYEFRLAFGVLTMIVLLVCAAGLDRCLCLAGDVL